MDVIDALRQQAESCHRIGSPMYGALLDAMTVDHTADGPTAAVLRGHEDDPGPSALGLRLLGSLHRLVLIGRAPSLERYYPTVGGTWDPVSGVDAVLEYLAADPDAVREWLDFFPQTNEVGRSVALIGGLLHLPESVRAPIRLFELGSSGGLNLLADRFRLLDTAGTGHGPADSPVVLSNVWEPSTGVRSWPGLEFVEASGCDIRPVPASTPEGATQLTAYAWPDQPHRIERLRGALALAAQYPPRVEQSAAGDFVDAIESRSGHLTVLWHSIMWQYVPAAEQQRITARLGQIGATATGDAPLVHLRLEPARPAPDADHEFLIQMTTWPGGTTTILGRAGPHGPPAHWDRGS